MGPAQRGHDRSSAVNVSRTRPVAVELGVGGLRLHHRDRVEAAQRSRGGVEERFGRGRLAAASRRCRRRSGPGSGRAARTRRAGAGARPGSRPRPRRGSASRRRSSGGRRGSSGQTSPAATRSRRAARFAAPTCGERGVARPSACRSWSASRVSGRSRISSIACRANAAGSPASTPTTLMRSGTKPSFRAAVTAEIRLDLPAPMRPITAITPSALAIRAAELFLQVRARPSRRTRRASRRAGRSARRLWNASSRSRLAIASRVTAATPPRRASAGGRAAPAGRGSCGRARRASSSPRTTRARWASTRSRRGDLVRGRAGPLAVRYGVRGTRRLGSASSRACSASRATSSSCGLRSDRTVSRASAINERGRPSDAAASAARSRPSRRRAAAAGAPGDPRRSAGRARPARRRTRRPAGG